MIIILKKLSKFEFYWVFSMWQSGSISFHMHLYSFFYNVSIVRNVIHVTFYYNIWLNLDIEIQIFLPFAIKVMSREILNIEGNPTFPWFRKPPCLAGEWRVRNTNIWNPILCCDSSRLVYPTQIEIKYIIRVMVLNLRL